MMEMQDKLIDVFLSNEWPLNFERGLMEYPKNIKNISHQIAILTNNINPRYHIVGLEGIFYQRKPYKNNKNLITRLISMGKVPKNKNEARLFFFNLMNDALLNKIIVIKNIYSHYK